MTDPWRDLQRQYFQRLRQDRPLDYSREEDRRLWVPLHDEAHDPVLRLRRVIDLSGPQSIQLVAGFRGSGKTTEFSRLEEMLGRDDYHVVRIDLDDYLDMHAAVDIREFLLILAGAIGERMHDERLLGKSWSAKPLGDRLRDFMQQEIELQEVSIKSPSMGVLPEMGWKFSVKGDKSLREQIRKALMDRVPRLAEMVRALQLEIIAALRKKHGPTAQLVVIVDSLEHLRGDPGALSNVHQSISEMFFVHGSRLELPDTHMVFSVPAYLAMNADNLASEFANGAVQVWPACHIWNSDRTPDPEGIARMRELIVRRAPEWRRILKDDAALESLVLGSGGYVKDLLSLAQEALLQATGLQPADPERVKRRVAQHYLPFFKEDVAVLTQIAADQNLRGVPAESRERVVRFLDAHLVLCYLNDEFWYDVHPLVRPELDDKGGA